MTASPDFAEHRIDQTAWRPATLDNAETKGDGYGRFVDVKECSTERRRQPPPSTPHGHLHELPALILLDRLRIPMLATGLDGVLIYTNPAFATMLGHCGTNADRTTAPRAAGRIFSDPEATIVSPHCARRHRGHRLAPRRGLPGPHRGIRLANLRATDPILVISITDISELIWTTRPHEAALVAMRNNAALTEGNAATPIDSAVQVYCPQF